MVKRFFYIILLISMINLACYTPVIESRGKLLETKVTTDYSRTVDYDPVLQEVELPTAHNPLLTVSVARRAIHPRVHLNVYQRMVLDREGSAYMGMYYGMIIGGVLYMMGGGGVVADSSGKLNSGRFLSLMALDLVTSTLGYWLGEKNAKPKPRGTLEEKTSTIVGYTKGDLRGPFQGVTVTLTVPFLEQRVQLETRADGQAVFDLSQQLFVDDWSPEVDTLTVKIGVGDTLVQRTVNPQFFLRPYFKITRKKDNVRRGHGVQYAVLGFCYQGERFRIYKQWGNWYEIDYHGVRGWVHRSNGQQVLGTEYHFDPQNPPRLEVQATFEDPSKNHILDAEEIAWVYLKFSNNGRGPAYQITAMPQVQTLSSHIRIIPPQPITVLEPGQTRKVGFQLIADSTLPDGELQIPLRFTDQFGFAPQPITLQVQTRAVRPPDLRITTITIDDDNEGHSFGDGDYQIELGETVETRLTVANQGEGMAKGVQVAIFTPAPNIFLGDQTHFQLGDLAPGETREISFLFSTNKLYRGQATLPIFATLSEARPRYSRKKIPLGLVLNRIIRHSPLVQVVPTNQSSAVDSFPVERVPLTGKSNPNAVAVVIGNRDYRTPGIPPVTFATRDAALVRQYLVNMFGYLPENIIYLENATKADMEQLFGTSSQPSGQLTNYIVPHQSEIFIYYTGHGAPDINSGETYFVPVDCDPNYIQLTGFPLNTFFKNLATIPAKRFIVVIDACFSGHSGAGFLFKNISPLILKIKNPVIQVPNLMLFTSSQADQVSHWYPEVQHSLFTYFFLKDLQREWRNTHQVNSARLFQQVYRHVDQKALRLFGRHQQPTFWGKKEEILF